MNMWRIIFGIVQRMRYGFPNTITGVWTYYERCYPQKSTFCVDEWKKMELCFSVGDIVPMFSKGGVLAFYKVIRAYYKMGDRFSDWGGVDGREKDFLFHHIEKR